MKLNKFIWDNYKETIDGKHAINIFKEFNIDLIVKNYLDNAVEIYGDPIDMIDDYEYIISPKMSDEMEEEEARDYFYKILDNGITIQLEEGTEEILWPNDDKDILYKIPLISIWLYSCYPDYFKPYLFRMKFKLFNQIADAFEIELPEVPQKKNKKERCQYYWKICEALNKFQKEHSLLNEEVCAFLYDFAPKFLNQNKTQIVEDLPSPTQVWMVGGNIGGGDIEFLNRAKEGDISNWQGNLETKRGDIVVMYCLAPQSSIHSIWRAYSDGYPDPFFGFYSLICISNPIKVPDIHIQELKLDNYFSKHSLVRSNMQGLNGRTLSSQDYEELLKLIQKKNFKISELPKLYHPTFTTNLEIKNERDVELQLLEPLIEKIGYEDGDWERQLTVRMGRGERNYPDYSFFVNGEKGFEKSKMIVEAKYLIKNNKELDETFKQAHSYALRLEASKIVLCDKNAIWIYIRESHGYDRDKYYKKFWQELEHADEFNKIKKMIGNVK